MTTARQIYQQRRNRLIAYGQWQPSIIPAEHVTAHIHHLVATGRSMRWIARAAGVHNGVIRRLASGASRHVAQHNADNILALSTTDRPQGTAWVHPAGTQRRLQALATLGWSLAQVAQLTGLHSQTLSRVRTSSTYVAADTAHRVAQTYQRLSRYSRPSDKATWVQRRAHRHGWAPPAAWSRYTIDDPTAGPLERSLA